MENLINKYNVPGPRYTSYPTVPFWEPETHTLRSWKEAIHKQFWQNKKQLSIYIHLPFCERLCTYCGCTTRITKNHSVESIYIHHLLKEWELYVKELGGLPIIKEIHLGGGTPTFFAPENLKQLINGILTRSELSPDFEFGFEAHPANTTEEHLKLLSDMGFTRISLGIQDFDPEVQQIINRKQSYEDVERVTRLARNYGFKSINYDLIYGLPKQSLESIAKTVARTIELAPSRIAFYGYAHIPWIKKGQKSFEEHLPTPSERAEMYVFGKQLLVANGYYDIGMDHFSLPSDTLYRAFRTNGLHRNFMGYTHQKNDLLIGLGMSSISDSWTAFSQNEKDLKSYYKKINDGELPVMKGHQLTTEDQVVRRHILNLMCQFRTSWDPAQFLDLGILFNVDLLHELENDGLIHYKETGIEVTEAGKPFIRNICMALDSRLWQSKKQAAFSQTV